MSEKVLFKKEIFQAIFARPCFVHVFQSKLENTNVLKIINEARYPFGGIAALSALSAAVLGLLGKLPQQNYILGDGWSAVMAAFFWVTLSSGIIYPVITMTLAGAEGQEVSASKRSVIALVALISAFVQTGIGWALALSNTPNGWMLFAVIDPVIMIAVALWVSKSRPPVYE